MLSKKQWEHSNQKTNRFCCVNIEQNLYIFLVCKIELGLEDLKTNHTIYTGGVDSLAMYNKNAQCHSES